MTVSSAAESKRTWGVRWALICGCLAAFVVLAAMVVQGETAWVDNDVLRFFLTPGPSPHPFGPPWLQEVGRDVTSIGSVVVLFFISAAAICFFILSGEARLAGLIFFTVAGGAALSTALKVLVGRPRPPIQDVVRVFTFGFPSGHATMSMCTALILGFVLARKANTPVLKSYVLGVAGFVIVAIGVSRLYLAVHYPSDIFGGWLVGAAWTLTCWALAMRRD